VRAVLNTTFRSLHIRNYRLFATGQLVKLVGVWMMFTAQDWLVLDLSHNSPGALGAVAALQFLPVLLLTLWGGKLADRYDKRMLLVAANAAFAITAMVFAVLVAGGVIVLWHVFLFAGLLGIANAIETPVRQAFVSELVERPLLPNALSLSAATFNTARIGGPALAGVPDRHDARDRPRRQLQPHAPRRSLPLRREARCGGHQDHRRPEVRA
jgi:MFS family permease